MIIAIDFDGTIVEHSFPEIGKPIPGAIDVIKELKKRGHKIILWTCRNNHDSYNGCRQSLSEALHYCAEHGITFDSVNQNVPNLGFNPVPKIYADLYIDDRSFPKIKPQLLWQMLLKAIDCKTSELNRL